MRKSGLFRTERNLVNDATRSPAGDRIRCIQIRSHPAPLMSEAVAGAVPEMLGGSKVDLAQGAAPLNRRLWARRPQLAIPLSAASIRNCLIDIPTQSRWPHKIRYKRWPGPVQEDGGQSGRTARFAGPGRWNRSRASFVKIKDTCVPRFRPLAPPCPSNDPPMKAEQFIARRSTSLRGQWQRQIYTRPILRPSTISWARVRIGSWRTCRLEAWTRESQAWTDPAKSQCRQV